MEIPQIKASLQLNQVLENYNLKPDTNSRLCCPWHDDKTPSLQIYAKTNTWTCFSSKCSAGSGDAIDFVMKYEGVSKHEALEKCKELLGHKTTTKELGRIGVLSKFYTSQLINESQKKDDLAVAYRNKRGLEKVEISHCTASILKYWKGSKKEYWKSVEQYGLERFRDCLVFALRNRSNQIVGLYGRKIKEGTTGKPTNTAGRHYYMSGPHQGLYPRWPEPTTKRLILTESVIDAASIGLAVREEKDTAVLALYGGNGFTADHKAAIVALKEIEEIILFMDGDEAGEAAIVKLIEQVQETNERVIISKVDTPNKEDANSILIKSSTSKLAELIKARHLLFSIEKPSIEEIDDRSSQEVKYGSASREETAKADGRQLITDNEELLVYQTQQLQISILGGIKITGLDKLRVTLKVESTQTRLPIRQSLDLYHGKSVEQLIDRISEEMTLSMSYTKQLISDLTGSLEQYREHRLDLLQTKKNPETYVMNAADRKAAMDYLKAPNLMNRTLRDISKSGIVGEQVNAMIGHIVYMSRKQRKPLHVMYLGSSGSGKTYLQEKLSEFVPEEDKKSVTALSDQSLYYQGKQLQHKVLYIEDIDGAENVMYMIRELQSKGRISKTVVWKDARGNMQSIDVVAEGPLSISSCTTREKVYEDNANRCILLYIDDSAEQDKRIMAYQRKLSAGKVNPSIQAQIKHLQKNVQRLLQPIRVINPYAEYIDLPQEVFKPRRSLQLLLSFIETVTYYHQYQRSVSIDKPSKTKYIASTVEDIEISFDLMKEVLFTKSDELSKACRSFLERLKSITKPHEIFYSGQVRKQLRLAPSTTKRYLIELVRHGYIKIKGGSRHRGYEYEIIDYKEYEKLKGSIDNTLAEILHKIRTAPVGTGGPVAQEWLTSTNGPLKQMTIKELSPVAQ